MGDINIELAPDTEHEDHEHSYTDKELEKNARHILENINDIPYISTKDGQLTYLGHQFERYGFSVREVRDRGVIEFIVPEDRDHVVQALAQSMSKGEEFPTTFRIETRSGEVRWLEDLGRVWRDEEGNIIGLIGVLRDITERKQSEKVLRANEERYRRLAEQSSDPLFIIDFKTKTLLYTSPSIERVTGYRPEELMGTAAEALPLDKERLVEGFTQIEREKELEAFELPFVCKDGTTALGEVNASLVDLGIEVQVQGAIRDITQRRTFEERLRQQQKMEALGTLAGGIAHDFNNLLTGILGGASLLKRCAENQERVEKTAEVIERAAIRASELTQHLLGFAKPGKPKSSTVNLHRVIEDVVDLLERTLNRRVEIVQQLHAHPPVVLGDAALLQQVVLNLVVNASDAMPKGGRILVGTENLSIDEEDLRKDPEVPRGSFVVLRVEDTGIGMKEDVRQRIFEPFFTTKETLGRSGLGLAMVYGIVTSHSGSLNVRTTPGKGSTFEVSLPSASTMEEGAVEHTNRPTPGRAHLLVVDDEEVVLEAAGVILPELGYKVRSARDGLEAIEIYTEHWRDIDLVILDLTMPFMNGIDCYHALRNINPQARVLLSTGHSLDAEVQALLEEGIIDFVQKPYTMRQLADKVSEALI